MLLEFAADFVALLYSLDLFAPDPDQMVKVRMCPKCHSKLKESSDGEVQYCPVCKYWTMTGSVRLDSIMIYE